MWNKHIITIEENKFVLKYNTKKFKIHIGGKARFIGSIDYFVEDFLNLELPINIHSQPSSIKYEFENVTSKQYRDIIKQIEDSENIIIEDVNNHGRFL